MPHFSAIKLALAYLLSTTLFSPDASPNPSLGPRDLIILATTADQQQTDPFGAPIPQLIANHWEPLDPGRVFGAAMNWFGDDQGWQIEVTSELNQGWNPVAVRPESAISSEDALIRADALPDLEQTAGLRAPPDADRDAVYAGLQGLGILEGTHEYRLEQFYNAMRRLAMGCGGLAIALMVRRAFRFWAQT